MPKVNIGVLVGVICYWNGVLDAFGIWDSVSRTGCPKKNGA